LAAFSSVSRHALPQLLLLLTGFLLGYGVDGAEAAPFPAISHGWTWAPTGAGIGWSGMSVGDLDADGNLEILADASGGSVWGAHYWFILEDVPAGKRMRHVSFPLSGQLQSLSAEQLDADAALEIALLEDSRLSVLDGATLQLQWDFDLGVLDPLDMAFGDLNGDSILELVVTTLYDVYVFDAATGSLLRTGKGLGGYSLDIGQADGDPELEIAVASADETGLIFDGESLAKQCYLGPYVGTQVAFGNVDDDDALEVVAARRGVGGIRAFDGSSCSPVWEIPAWEVDTFSLADLEGDGVTELIYADSQSGPVHVLNLQTRSELWSVWNPLSGALRIAMGDLNHDGQMEIVFGAGHHSSGPDRLVIVDPALRTVAWESADVSGAMFGIDVGDVDGDGKVELVGGALFSESSYAGGKYLYLDDLAGRVEFMSEPKSTGIWRLAVADIDGDGRGEICFPSAQPLLGLVSCDDPSAHAEIWQAPLGPGQRVGAMRTVDLDDDGADDLVVSTTRSDTSGAGIFVHAYEGEAEVWSSQNLQTLYFASLDLMRVGQTDDDEPLEIVVADSQAGIVFILDGGDGGLQSSGSAPGIVALDLVDIDRDGKLEVAWAPRDGEILIVDPGDWTVRQSRGPFAGLDAFLFRELTGDAAAELILSANGTIRIWDAVTGAGLWESPWLGTRAGALDSLFVFERDSSSSKRIAVNLAYGLAVFDVGPERVFCDSFESGDGSEWRSESF
jgi:hypothetical protein